MFILWRTKSKLFSVARRLSLLIPKRHLRAQSRDGEIHRHAAKALHIRARRGCYATVQWQTCTRDRLRKGDRCSDRTPIRPRRRPRLSHRSEPRRAFHYEQGTTFHYASEVRFTALDLTEPDAAAKLATDVEQSWGGLDILVTNAGAAPQGGFLELKDEDWAAGFGLKLFANLRVIKSTWPMLKAVKGHLIMIGGGTARTPERHLALVSAVNGGIAALSKSIAEQGLQDCVHVNLVQPGHDQDLHAARK